MVGQLECGCRVTSESKYCPLHTAAPALLASVKELREKRAWSQEQLAGIAGISLRTVQRIESGKPASFESLKTIASAFDFEQKLRTH